MRFHMPGVQTIKDISSVAVGIAAACGIIAANAFLFEEKLPEPCQAQGGYVPMIQEFAADHLVLSGGLTSLRVGQSYPFETGDVRVIIRLVHLDSTGADFVYDMLEESAGEPPTIQSQTFHAYCTMHIRPEDSTYRPHLAGRLLAPADFPPDWHVSKYTEYLNFFYTPFDTKDTAALVITAGPKRPFLISVFADVFQSEDDASSYYKTYSQISDDTRTDPGFITRAAPVREGCYATGCDYFAQVGDAIIHVSGLPVSQSTLIDPKDWQTLITLLEAKLGSPYDPVPGKDGARLMPAAGDTHIREGG